MDKGRHREVLERPEVRRRVRAALTLVKAAALGALLSLVVIGGLRTTTSGSSTSSVDDAYDRVEARATATQHCSTDGSEPAGHGTAGAASAVIRTQTGALRAVSFRAGWDVYSGHRPGELVAVCLDDRRATARLLQQAADLDAR